MAKRAKVPKGWPRKAWLERVPWVARVERLRVVYGCRAYGWNPGIGVHFSDSPYAHPHEICGDLLDAMDRVAKGVRPDLADDETAAWEWAKNRDKE